MSASSAMRVAVVGCGGMGRSHLNVLKSLSGFEIAAVCDVVPASASDAATAFEVEQVFTDYEALYAAIEPDLVVIATQTRDHCAPTVAALRQGISVLCEKPIAIDLSEADAMVAAAEESGAKLAIHQQNHLHPGIRKAVELVAAGRIGEIVLVRGRNKAGRKSGNEFMEMGTHVADMMLRFGGRPEWCSGVVTVRGRLAGPGDIMEAKEMSPGDRDSGLVMGERAMGRFGFEGGILGEVHFFDYAKTMNSNYGVDVLGTEGQLAVRAGGGAEHAGLWHLPRPMEGTPDQGRDWQRVDLSSVGEENPMIAMYRALAEAIRTDTRPPCDGVTGRWALEMLMGIYESHRRNGERVALPLADRRHPLERWRESA